MVLDKGRAEQIGKKDLLRKGKKCKGSVRKERKIVCVGDYISP